MKTCLLVAMACSTGIVCEAVSEEADYSLELKGWRQTIQVGENVQFELVIRGAQLADLARQSPAIDPASGEWKGDMVFRACIGHEPKTPRIEKVGPFEIEFQGRHLKSGSVLVEVTEEWKHTEERYEFRVFPRTVRQGDKIIVVFRQQYSTKPFFDPARQNLFSASSDGRSWDSRGSMGWRVGHVYYNRDEYWFELAALHVGKMIITRKDVPELPELIEFKPIEVEVLRPGTTPHPH